MAHVACDRVPAQRTKLVSQLTARVLQLEEQLSRASGGDGAASSATGAAAATSLAVATNPTIADLNTKLQRLKEVGAGVVRLVCCSHAHVVTKFMSWPCAGTVSRRSARRQPHSGRQCTYSQGEAGSPVLLSAPVHRRVAHHATDVQVQDRDERWRPTRRWC